MSALISFIGMLLRILLPVVVNASKDTAEDSDTQSALKNKLLDKVRKTWPVLLCVVMLTGCFTRTIYVPSGTPVRIRETIKDAKVWVKTTDGKVVEGQLDLLEGWYALSADPEE